MKSRCNACNKLVDRKNMPRHRRTHNIESFERFACDQCGKSFSRKDNLQQHKLRHGTKDLFCDVAMCHAAFRAPNDLAHHRAKVHHEGGLRCAPSPSTRRRLASAPSAALISPSPSGLLSATGSNAAMSDADLSCPHDTSQASPPRPVQRPSSYDAGTPSTHIDPYQHITAYHLFHEAAPQACSSQEPSSWYASGHLGAPHLPFQGLYAHTPYSDIATPGYPVDIAAQMEGADLTTPHWQESPHWSVTDSPAHEIPALAGYPPEAQYEYDASWGLGLVDYRNHFYAQPYGF